MSRVLYQRRKSTNGRHIFVDDNSNEDRLSRYRQLLFAVIRQSKDATIFDRDLKRLTNFSRHEQKKRPGKMGEVINIEYENFEKFDLKLISNLAEV
jgi:hypothetical protein